MKNKETNKSRKFTVAILEENKKAKRDFGMISGYKVEKVGSKKTQKAKKYANKVIFSMSF